MQKLYNVLDVRTSNKPVFSTDPRCNDLLLHCDEPGHRLYIACIDLCEEGDIQPQINLA